MTAERKIFISAVIYGILGLVAGFFGRTYTHSMGMEDSNHLSVLHTHILTLGFFFFLITLALCNEMNSWLRQLRLRLRPLPLRKGRERAPVSFLRSTEPRPCASKTRVVASPNSVSEPRKNPTQGGGFTWLRLQVTDFKIK